jgi:hypothetical protein
MDCTLKETGTGGSAALDLSGELIVQLGLVTEDLDRRWYSEEPALGKPFA